MKEGSIEDHTCVYKELDELAKIGNFTLTKQLTKRLIDSKIARTAKSLEARKKLATCECWK